MDDNDDQEVPGHEPVKDRTGDPWEAAIARLRHRPRPPDEIRETWLRERRAARVSWPSQPPGLSDRHTTC